MSWLSSRNCLVSVSVTPGFYIVDRRLREAVGNQWQERRWVSMLIDCDQCVMQHTDACDDCFVMVVLDVTAHQGGNRVPVELDEEEAEAVGNLAELGLVPQLRLVTRYTGGSDQDRSTATG